MRDILEYEISDIIPDLETVLIRQGMPKEHKPNKTVIKTAERALELFTELSSPIGIVMDVSIEQFDHIYAGEGENASETPVGEIYPRADNLALFAITMGEDVCDEINDLFDENDFALASMLDTIASEATERAGIITESDFLNGLIDEKRIIKENQVLRYSPGYCGWHISGQRKLFEHLAPEEIGIGLFDSYLMLPVKSISGVMIVGSAEIHNFAIAYKFCDSCDTKSCRMRIKQIFNNVRS